MLEHKETVKRPWIATANMATLINGKEEYLDKVKNDGDDSKPGVQAVEVLNATIIMKFDRS